jgi:hypothetical protein
MKSSGMLLLSFAVACVAAVATAPAAAQNQPSPIAAWSRTTAASETAGTPAEHGAAVFNNWRSACHSRDTRNAPGTSSLQHKYQGSVPAALEDRTDLTAEIVELFVRYGVATMPFYRKSRSIGKRKSTIPSWPRLSHISRGTEDELRNGRCDADPATAAGGRAAFRPARQRHPSVGIVYKAGSWSRCLAGSGWRDALTSKSPVLAMTRRGVSRHISYRAARIADQAWCWDSLQAPVGRKNFNRPDSAQVAARP